MKKLIAAILLLALVLSVFASCNGDSGEKDGETTDDVTTDAVTTAPDTDAPGTKAPVTDAPEVEPESAEGLLFLPNADGTGCTVVGMTEDNTALEILIPPTLNGLPVKALGEKAFAGKRITAITIPEGVTEIGPW